MTHVPLDGLSGLTLDFGASGDLSLHNYVFPIFNLSWSNGKASPQIYGVDLFQDFETLGFDPSLIFSPSFTEVVKSKGLLG